MVLSVEDVPQPPPGVWQPRCPPGALAGATELFRAGMSLGVQGGMLRPPGSSPLVLPASSHPKSIMTQLLPSAPWHLSSFGGAEGKIPSRAPLPPILSRRPYMPSTGSRDVASPSALQPQSPTELPLNPPDHTRLGCWDAPRTHSGCWDAPGFGRSWSEVPELQPSRALGSFGAHEGTWRDTEVPSDDAGACARCGFPERRAQGQSRHGSSSVGK